MALVFWLSACEKTSVDIVDINSKPTHLSPAEITVFEGRLKFSTPKALMAYVNSAIEYSQTKHQGFRPLKGYYSVSSDLEYLDIVDEEPFEIPKKLLDLLNENREYQVGDSIVFLSGRHEFIVPIENSYLLDEVRAKIKSGDESPDVIGVHKFELKKILFEPTAKTSSIDKNGGHFVDAKYQKEFGLNGHTYKFVFEVFGFQEFFLLYYGTNAKFEYRCGRNKWCKAGEPVIKQISNFSAWVASGSPFPFGATYLTLNWSGFLNNNQDLSYVNAVATDCLFDLRFTGSYYANAYWANQIYEIPDAEWRKGTFCK